jgi:hypothetical protein
MWLEAVSRNFGLMVTVGGFPCNLLCHPTEETIFMAIAPSCCFSFCIVRNAEKNYSTMVSRLWEEPLMQIKKLCLLPNTSTTQYLLQRNIPKNNEQLPCGAVYFQIRKTKQN